MRGGPTEKEGGERGEREERGERREERGRFLRPPKLRTTHTKGLRYVHIAVAAAPFEGALMYPF